MGTALNGCATRTSGRKFKQAKSESKVRLREVKYFISLADCREERWRMRLFSQPQNTLSSNCHTLAAPCNLEVNYRNLQRIARQNVLHSCRRSTTRLPPNAPFGGKLRSDENMRGRSKALNSFCFFPTFAR